MTVFEEEDHISTDNLDIPLRKRVISWFNRYYNKRQVSKFGKKAARFINMQFAFIVVAFFVLSLNAISAQANPDTSLVNPLLNYEPATLADSSVQLNHYIPVLQSIPDQQTRDQVLSAVAGPETAYVPKPMLVQTIDHDTADRQLRGLRGETVHHTVQQGETLSKIASTYGISLATIMKDNGIDPTNVNKIKPGTDLAIAPESSTDAASWLAKIQAQEEKDRQQKLAQQQAQQAKLAKASASKKSLLSSAIAADSSGDTGGGSGLFHRPIGGYCHNGYHWWAVDCPNPPGTAVGASAAGTVSIADSSGWNGGYGKTIVIDHGNGWQTRYAHLSQVNVSPGDQVSAGDIIALSGNTGNSTGPHLHFEIIKNGQRLNPADFGMGSKN